MGRCCHAPAARFQDADPAQLVRLLEDALRWLKKEWFEPWLSDEAHGGLALDLDVGQRPQLHRLGTPYLEDITDLVCELTRELLDALPTEAESAISTT